jgi:hypothetical protein
MAVTGCVVLLGRFDLEQLAALVVDLKRGVLELKALVQHRFDHTASGMAVAARTDEHVARERGEAEVTSHTCRSCTSTTSGGAAIDCPI